MIPIAIFYHCLFAIGNPPTFLDQAYRIVTEQMNAVTRSGLYEATSHFVAGVNGDQESWTYAASILPARAQIVLHGLDSRAENLTIVELEKWAKSNPGWGVLYFHSKGATHAAGNHYGDNVSAPWRRGMMQDLVENWRTCVNDLTIGYDIACSHWMWNMADGTQHIPAGNFLWIRSDFVAKLPSIFMRDRIKQSGIAALESRYEAEVYWGNGPRPNVKQYRPNGGGGIP